MGVRLSFAVMTQIDADVMLVDEVLAVGDSRFQAKCVDTLLQMKAEGRTIILVSHAMDSIRKFCDNAILIERGKVESMGSADHVAAAYEAILGADQAHAHINSMETGENPVLSAPS